MTGLLPRSLTKEIRPQGMGRPAKETVPLTSVLPGPQPVRATRAAAITKANTRPQRRKGVGRSRIDAYTLNTFATGAAWPAAAAVRLAAPLYLPITNPALRLRRHWASPPATRYRRSSGPSGR